MTFNLKSTFFSVMLHSFVLANNLSIIETSLIPRKNGNYYFCLRSEHLYQGMLDLSIHEAVEMERCYLRCSNRGSLD